MDDDVWEDDENLSYPSDSTNNTFSKDLDKLEDIHTKQGYKDGIVAGESQAAQEGFDEGYRQGANSAIEFGKMLGNIIGLSRLSLDPDLQQEVNDLLSEGWQLSRNVENLLSGDGFQRYQDKFKGILAKVQMQK